MSQHAAFCTNLFVRNEQDERIALVQLASISAAPLPLRLPDRIVLDGKGYSRDAALLTTRPDVHLCVEATHDPADDAKRRTKLGGFGKYLRDARKAALSFPLWSGDAGAPRLVVLPQVPTMPQIALRQHNQPLPGLGIVCLASRVRLPSWTLIVVAPRDSLSPRRSPPRVQHNSKTQRTAPTLPRVSAAPWRTPPRPAA